MSLGPAPETASSPVLGLDARSTPDGALVVGVAPGTAAWAAGLRAGDLITRADDLAPPSFAQLSRLFDALTPGQAMLLAFTRDGAHHVVGLVK